MRGQLLSTLLLAGLTSSVGAQSQQHWSIQGSGALVFPTADESEFENSTRLGWEAQVRYTFSRFSMGAGYQRSTVYQFSTGDFSAAVSVFFAEPRYVVFAGSRAAVYLAGRVGMSTLVCNPEEDCADQGGHFAGGGGGGVLVRLGSRVALDLGSQYFTTQYDIVGGTSRTAGYVLARLGLSVGL
ncbi:MAG TPA: hypothetical protein VJU15_05660 [Gemmatimonadales bacterium]|nr:hypothetical protein [Gemmatimonadales bacterium]